jgi:hypothetical protein
MALRSRLHRVVPFSWSSLVPNVGRWSGFTPAGCEVLQGSLQMREPALDHGQLSQPLTLTERLSCEAGHMTAPDRCCRNVRKFLPRRSRCRSLGTKPWTRQRTKCARSRHYTGSMLLHSANPHPTAIADWGGFVRRLMNAFGTPNLVWPLDLCGWSRGFATRSVGTSAGGAILDISRSGCLPLWGYNPSYPRLTHATAIIDAFKRG